MIARRWFVMLDVLVLLVTGGIVQACVPAPKPAAAPPATDANKALVRRYYEDVLSAGQMEVLDELLAPSYKRYLTASSAPLDAAAQMKRLAGMRTVFPDLNINIDDMIAEGDRVAVRMTIHGTQKAAYQGIAPTGKQVAVSATEVIRLENGKFVEHWGGADGLDLLQQLGGVVSVAPPVAPAASADSRLLDLAKVYEDAYNRHDVDALVAMFTEKGLFDEQRLYECAGTVPIAPDVEVVRGCIDFAMAFNPRLHLSACQVKESEVTCQAVLQDDWIGLLYPQGLSYSTYAFTVADGKIATVQTVLVKDEVTHKLLDGMMEGAPGLAIRATVWSSVNAPDDFNKAFKPDGSSFILTAEAARTWMGLTKRYLAAHSDLWPVPTPAQ